MSIEIHHTKTPIKIWSGYLGVPNDYKDNLINATNEQYKNAPSESSFYDVFNEKNGKVVATGYKAWEEVPTYSKLIKAIEFTFNKWVENDNWWSNGGKTKYKVIEAWSGVYNENQTTNSHHHTPSPISFCYYIDAEAPYTPMVFDQSDLSIDAKTDLLICFPGFIWHSVPPCKNKRIFIAGNMIDIK